MRYIIVISLILSNFLFGEYSRFTRMDVGVVTDHEYGLQWQDDTNHSAEWEDAISYCEELSLDGKDDWRMPNINEISFIIDMNRTSPSINKAFQNTKLTDSDCNDGNNIYWSATSSDENRSNAIGIYFTDGRNEPKLKKTYVVGSDETKMICSVRCVRSDFD